MYSNYDCPLCGKYVDSQEHALSCEEVTRNLEVDDQTTLSTVSYSDLFQDIGKQLIITKLYDQIIKLRQRLLIQGQAHHGLI